MMNKFLLLIAFFLGWNVTFSQELNCQVVVNSERITGANQQIFRTLESSLNEFVNKTKWTNQNIKQNEKIDCSFFINVSEFSNNRYVATLQVNATRTAFNSTYSTPVFTFSDKDFSFDYTEFQMLFFNPNSFDSNLVSVIAFYVYTVLGMDADTFTMQGGDAYFLIAQNIVTQAQSSGYKGWNQADGFQTRYFLVNDLMSSTFKPFREAMYQYHVDGLDKMSDDVRRGKESVKNALMTMGRVHQVRPNAFLTRVFFDTKADEVVSIFSGGPRTNISELVDNLNRISPLNASKWSQIKM